MKEVEVLLQAGVILYPTDTIWGIGCDATNACAIERVVQIKGRDRANKNLIVLVADLDMLKNYVESVPDEAIALMQTVKEPLTIIYPNIRNLPLHLLSSNGSLGIRIVQHDYCQRLIRALGRPLVSTSANVSGKQSPLCFEQVELCIRQGVDYIADVEHDKISAYHCSHIYALNGDKTVTKLR